MPPKRVKDTTTPPGKKRKVSSSKEQEARLLKLYKLENAAKYETLLSYYIPFPSKLEKRLTSLAIKNTQKIDYKSKFFYKDFLKITKQAIRASITENNDEFNSLFSTGLQNEIKDIRTELKREANEAPLNADDLNRLDKLHTNSKILNNQAMNDILKVNTDPFTPEQEANLNQTPVSGNEESKNDGDEEIKDNEDNGDNVNNVNNFSTEDYKKFFGSGFGSGFESPPRDTSPQHNVPASPTKQRSRTSSPVSSLKLTTPTPQNLQYSKELLDNKKDENAEMKETEQNSQQPSIIFQDNEETKDEDRNDQKRDYKNKGSLIDKNEERKDKFKDNQKDSRNNVINNKRFSIFEDNENDETKQADQNTSIETLNNPLFTPSVQPVESLPYDGLTPAQREKARQIGQHMRFLYDKIDELEDANKQLRTNFKNQLDTVPDNQIIVESQRLNKGLIQSYREERAEIIREMNVIRSQMNDVLDEYRTLSADNARLRSLNDDQLTQRILGTDWVYATPIDEQDAVVAVDAVLISPDSASTSPATSPENIPLPVSASTSPATSPENIPLPVSASTSPATSPRFPSESHIELNTFFTPPRASRGNQIQNQSQSPSNVVTPRPRLPADLARDIILQGSTVTPTQARVEQITVNNAIDRQVPTDRSNQINQSFYPPGTFSDVNMSGLPPFRPRSQRRNEFGRQNPNLIETENTSSEDSSTGYNEEGENEIREAQPTSEVRSYARSQSDYTETSDSDFEDTPNVNFRDLLIQMTEQLNDLVNQNYSNNQDLQQFLTQFQQWMDRNMNREVVNRANQFLSQQLQFILNIQPGQSAELLQQMFRPDLSTTLNNPEVFQRDDPLPTVIRDFEMLRTDFLRLIGNKREMQMVEMPLNPYINRSGIVDSVHMHEMAIFLNPSAMTCLLRYLASSSEQERAQMKNNNFFIAQLIRLTASDPTNDDELTNENLPNVAAQAARQLRENMQPIFNAVSVEEEERYITFKEKAFRALILERQHVIKENREGEPPGPGGPGGPGDENLQIFPHKINRDKMDQQKNRTQVDLIKAVFDEILLLDDNNQIYVPIHKEACVFFFENDDYETLKKKFFSMKPCRIRTPIPFAYDRLLGLVKLYGRWLDIEVPLSTPESHPIFVQHECLEVEQLVQAFSRYQQRCAPAYPIVTPQPQSQPQVQQPVQQPQEPPAQSQQDQNDTISNQFNSGISNNNQTQQRNSFLNNWLF